MKQHSNCIIGDIERVSNFTANWYSLKFRPGTFYRKHSEIIEILDKIKGNYAELDFGEYVDIRFSDQDDLNYFCSKYYEYV
jgi:hypothetical protein